MADNGNGSATTVLVTVVIIVIIGLAFYFGFARSNFGGDNGGADINVTIPTGQGGGSLVE
jgi:hypothetical protein